MSVIINFREQVGKMLESADQLQDDFNRQVYERAPIIVHQRLCSEFMKEAKKHPNVIPINIPEAAVFLKGNRSP